MSNKSERKSRSRPSGALLVLTSVFGILYVLFVASGSYGMTGPEPFVVWLLFLLFLVGYAVVWRDERIGGMVFIMWWAGMWYLGLFVAQEDRGAGAVIGFPLFVLGVLFVISGYRKRKTEKPGS